VLEDAQQAGGQRGREGLDQREVGVRHDALCLERPEEAPLGARSGGDDHLDRRRVRGLVDVFAHLAVHLRARARPGHRIRRQAHGREAGEEHADDRTAPQCWPGPVPARAA
jgi:hypothetical protein